MTTTPLLQDDPTRTADHGYFSWERPACTWTRAEIAEHLLHALIRKHFVDWGNGSIESAATCLRSCEPAEAEAVDAELHAAIANGASDADVAALARDWQRKAFKRAVDNLWDAALAGQDIAFPVTR